MSKSTRMSLTTVSLLLLVLAGVIPICTNCSGPRGTESSQQQSAAREGAFWLWFQKNQDRLYNFEANQNQVFNELEEQLHKVHPDLTFEFGKKQSDGCREFVISAGGIRDAFPSVIALYNTAPKLRKWKVTKFRPRRDFMIIETEGLKVAPDDIRFSLKPEGKLANLTLYIKGYDGSTRYKQIGFLMLDGALGEYDVETKVGALEFKAADRDEFHIERPIQELPGAIDRLSQPASK